MKDWWGSMLYGAALSLGALILGAALSVSLGDVSRPPVDRLPENAIGAAAASFLLRVAVRRFRAYPWWAGAAAGLFAILALWVSVPLGDALGFDSDGLSRSPPAPFLELGSDALFLTAMVLVPASILTLVRRRG